MFRSHKGRCLDTLARGQRPEPGTEDGLSTSHDWIDYRLLPTSDRCRNRRGRSLLNFQLKASRNTAILHDLRLDVNNRVAQIDHLVLHRTRNIFVLRHAGDTTLVQETTVRSASVPPAYSLRECCLTIPAWDLGYVLEGEGGARTPALGAVTK